MEQDLDLMKALSWAIVELDARKPDIVSVKKVLNIALERALQLEHKVYAAQKSLRKIAQVNGE